MFQYNNIQSVRIFQYKHIQPVRTFQYKIFSQIYLLLLLWLGPPLRTCSCAVWTTLKLDTWT
jgi:hypothetical protein